MQESFLTFKHVLSTFKQLISYIRLTSIII